jgi:hypothetical protein
MDITKLPILTLCQTNMITFLSWSIIILFLICWLQFIWFAILKPDWHILAPEIKKIFKTLQVIFFD